MSPLQVQYYFPSALLLLTVLQVSLLYFFVSLLVAGFYVDVNSIPAWFRWLQYTTPVRYFYDALAVNEFKGSEDFSAATTSYDEILEYQGISVNSKVSGDEILDNLDLVFESVWPNMALLALIALFMRVFAFFVLDYTTRLKT